jgi:hypothetical protein
MSPEAMNAAEIRARFNEPITYIARLTGLI